MQLKKLFLMLVLAVSSVVYSQYRDLEAQVNAYYGHGDTLGVVRTLGIRDLISQGIIPHSIVVYADSGRGRHRMGSVSLLINGMPTGIQKQLGHNGYAVLPLRNQGRGVRSIQLQFLGSEVYVQSIQAQFSGGGGGRGQRVMADIYQNYYGRNTLRVKGLLNQYGTGRIQGKSIQRVILKASSVGRRSATATLFINGQRISSQRIMSSNGRVVFELPRHMQRNIVVGRNSQGPIGGRLIAIRTIQIELSGDVYVERVGVKLGQGGVIRPGPGPGPRPLPNPRPGNRRRPGRGPRNI